MGIIQLLDTKTANKIAAGEVVVNPASVVKELVENSLDAGSTRITVEIISGGTECIKVTDNGGGIAFDDLETAFKRHATSKIKNFEDLNSVLTMGFRGEALAAIASVSKVTLTSRTKGSNEGNRIVVEAGLSQPPAPVGCAEGTTIEVWDLFYNVPARRKFLKSISRETAAVNEVMSRLAMGFPQTAIKLKNDGKVVFETYGNGDLLSTIVSILGKDTSEQLIPVEKASQGSSVKGFISNPFYGRSSRKYQYFYLNRRWISNQSMRYALDHAYRTMLPKGRFPTAVLFIETNSTLVDVNVDPTKNTVRINNEKAVLDLIIAAARDALSAQGPGKTVENDQRGKNRFSFPEQRDNFGERSPNMAVFSAREIWESYRPEINPREEYQKKTTFLPAAGDEGEAEEKGTGDHRILAQLDNSYILYEKDKSLFIVDQHAAHEKVRYEAIKSSLAIEGRQLVLPQTISLNPRQMALIEQFSESLQRAGFQFDYFGDNWVVLREIPIEISFGDPKEVFLEILDETDSNLASCQHPGEAFIISFACKTAVKAGQKLSVEEMESLLEALLRCKEPQTCPHGRPTTICLSAGALLKEFKRI